jgi:hypothetical protein
MRSPRSCARIVVKPIAMVSGMQSASDDKVSLLEQRVEEARRDYELVLAQTRKLLDQARTDGLDGAASKMAIQNAARMQAAATTRYSQALKELSDFMLGRHAAHRT